MKIGLIADTHDRMHPDVLYHFKGVDAIFHAGDIGGEDIITLLETVAPVYAVHGNTDTFPVFDRYPEWQHQELGGKRILMTHILPRATPADLERALALSRVKTRPDVFIYGHSHQDHVENIRGILTINPGAAGPPRFKLKPTIAFLDISPDGTMETRVQQLRWPVG